MHKYIDEIGRIVIPKEMRNALGLCCGDLMHVELDNDKIIIRKSYTTDEDLIKQIEYLQDILDKRQAK